MTPTALLFCCNPLVSWGAAQMHTFVLVINPLCSLPSFCDDLQETCTLTSRQWSTSTTELLGPAGPTLVFNCIIVDQCFSTICLSLFPQAGVSNHQDTCKQHFLEELPRISFVIKESGCLMICIMDVTSSINTMGEASTNCCGMEGKWNVEKCWEIPLRETARQKKRLESYRWNTSQQCGVKPRKRYVMSSKIHGDNYCAPLLLQRPLEAGGVCWFRGVPA